MKQQMLWLVLGLVVGVLLTVAVVTVGKQAPSASDVGENFPCIPGAVEEDPTTTTTEGESSGSGDSATPTPDVTAPTDPSAFLRDIFKVETAQARESSSVIGQVVDSKGRPISGATVRYDNNQSGLYGQTFTDSNGKFSVRSCGNPNVKNNTYTLTIVKPGYDNYGQEFASGYNHAGQISLSKQ